MPPSRGSFRRDLLRKKKCSRLFKINLNKFETKLQTAYWMNVDVLIHSGTADTTSSTDKRAIKRMGHNDEKRIINKRAKDAWVILVKTCFKMFITSIVLLECKCY